MMFPLLLQTPSLNKDSDNQLSVNATAYLADSKYGTIAYAKDFDNGHMATINARYMSYGSIPRTDESGFKTEISKLRMLPLVQDMPISLKKTGRLVED
jgi:hypothetical protein